MKAVFVNYICEQKSIGLYIYCKRERTTGAVLELLVKLKGFECKIVIYISLCKIANTTLYWTMHFERLHKNIDTELCFTHFLSLLDCK